MVLAACECWRYDVLMCWLSQPHKSFWSQKNEYKNILPFPLISRFPFSPFTHHPVITVHQHSSTFSLFYDVNLTHHHSDLSSDPSSDPPTIIIHILLFPPRLSPINNTLSATFGRFSFLLSFFLPFFLPFFFLSHSPGRKEAS